MSEASDSPNPVALLVEIEHLQDQLWQEACLEMPQISKPESAQAIDADGHNEAISILSTITEISGD